MNYLESFGLNLASTGLLKCNNSSTAAMGTSARTFLTLPIWTRWGSLLHTCHQSDVLFFSLPDKCAHTRGAQIETVHMFSLTSCSDPHTCGRCCGPHAQISSTAKVQTSKYLKPCLITATNDVSWCESFWRCDESRMWTCFWASCCVICPPQHLAKCDLTGWF